LLAGDNLGCIDAQSAADCIPSMGDESVVLGMGVEQLGSSSIGSPEGMERGEVKLRNDDVKQFWGETV
jgi:hypothetical protein